MAIGDQKFSNLHIWALRTSNTNHNEFEGLMGFKHAAVLAPVSFFLGQLHIKDLDEPRQLNNLGIRQVSSSSALT